MHLRGAIDLHVHCAPDTSPRKMTALELVCRARGAGMRGLLLKNHDTPTTALAQTIRELKPGLEVFGGVVLNDAVGGLNPAAVETALRLGAKQVWMPTHCAAFERRYRGKERGLRIVDDTGAVLPVVREICSLVGEAGAILGTGHVSPDETCALAAVVRECGVRRLLVTHPEIAFLNFAPALQLRLVGPGVWFERCYARAGFAVDWDGLARSIREIGHESTVLSTDLGQPGNPDPVSGLAEMASQLAARGFSSDELRVMMCENPARLLGN